MQRLRLWIGMTPTARAVSDGGKNKKNIYKVSKFLVATCLFLGYFRRYSPHLIPSQRHRVDMSLARRYPTREMGRREGIRNADYGQMNIRRGAAIPRISIYISQRRTQNRRAWRRIARYAVLAFARAHTVADWCGRCFDEDHSAFSDLLWLPLSVSKIPSFPMYGAWCVCVWWGIGESTVFAVGHCITC
jgi:hypothetical protein